MATGAKLEGLERLLRKASPALLATPLRNFLTRGAVAVQGRARQNAPVDSGHLRSSIDYQVDGDMLPRWAAIGTKVFYGPFMEFGTGVFAEGPGGRGGRHWPPGAALSVWASRHGFASGFAAARAIGRAGGLRPRRYLRRALADSLSDIRGFLARLGQELAAAWERR